MRRIALVLTAVIAAVLGTAATPWPTDHGDNRRSGYNPQETSFRAFSGAWHRPLDGQVLASPIIAGVNLIVATENDTVYGLNPTTGAVHWTRHLLTPAPPSSLPCSGNINPSGITGTPAFDPATNRVFVVTNSVNAQYGAHHEIFALDASTGKTVMNRRIVVPGTAENAEQQRGALAVSGKNVYVPFGGLAGDCGNYKGAVLSLRTNGQLGDTAWVVPTAREAGIWAPGGPVVNTDGSVFVAIGNGASTSGAYDGSDSVTRISGDSKRMDYFAPSSWASDNANDLDLGSMTPAITANGHILQAGKSGTAYVLNASHLGGIGGQVMQGSLCSAYGVSAVTGNTVYMPCSNGLTRVDVFSNGTFRKIWSSSSSTGSPVAGPGAIYDLNGQSLIAFNASTGQVLSSISFGVDTTRFTTPALLGKLVFVGTTSSVVAIKVAP